MNKILPFIRYNREQWIEELKPRNHLPAPVRRQMSDGSTSVDLLGTWYVGGILVVLSGIALALQSGMKKKS